MGIKKVLPGARSGFVSVPASKSWAHRLLITAALSSDDSRIICDGISKDISATVKCLNSLGADINISSEKNGSAVISVSPILKKHDQPQAEKLYSHLFCGESGSTLRFLIPVVGALGINAAFHMEGRLAERPLGPLISVLSEHGMSFRQDGQILYINGKLENGSFSIPGNISSQYISGLIMALPLINGNSIINVTGNIESGDYIRMTVRAAEESGIKLKIRDNIFNIEGGQKYKVSDIVTVEKDWSSAAFPLCMGAFSEEGITVTGLNPDSVQGDKEIIDILKRFGANISIQSFGTENTSVNVKKGNLKGQEIDASRIPDLVPVISAVAAGADGETKIVHAERLRLKESDRLMTTAAMLNAIGADVKITEDGLLIRGKKKLNGGNVDSYNDHRIAMSAAVAAGICKNEIVIEGSECTDKSFPGFWDFLEKLMISY